MENVYLCQRETRRPTKRPGMSKAPVEDLAQSHLSVIGTLLAYDQPRRVFALYTHTRAPARLDKLA